MALLTAQDLDKTIILQPDESIVLNLDEFKQSDKSITEYMHRNKTIIDEISAQISAQISIDASELITIQKIQQMATITSIQETISILNNTYGIDDLSLVFCALNDILMDFQFLNRLLAISQQESKKVENVCSNAMDINICSDLMIYCKNILLSYHSELICVINHSIWLIKNEMDNACTRWVSQASVTQNKGKQMKKEWIAKMDNYFLICIEAEVQFFQNMFPQYNYEEVNEDGSDDAWRQTLIDIFTQSWGKRDMYINNIVVL
eukprot:867784_1